MDANFVIWNLRKPKHWEGTLAKHILTWVKILHKSCRRGRKENQWGPYWEKRKKFTMISMGMAKMEILFIEVDLM